jgi:dephospho-CoA kinase
MITLVCTGGIGSGKSYVVKILNRLGIPSYIADSKAKDLYKRDNQLLSDLVKLLGDDIVVHGELKRDVMASKIFPNPELLGKVNDIVHPRVLKDFEEWSRQMREQGKEIVVFESAIFFESPVFLHIADKVLVVTAPEDIRIQRVIKRDGISEDLIRERIERQMPDSERVLKADYVIFTDGKRAVLPQVTNLLHKLKREYKIV